MRATEYKIIQLPLCEASIEFAENYCAFYNDAEFFQTAENVTITHRVPFDPTESVFWPGNGIKA